MYKKYMKGYCRGELKPIERYRKIWRSTKGMNEHQSVQSEQRGTKVYREI